MDETMRKKQWVSQPGAVSQPGNHTARAPVEHGPDEAVPHPDQAAGSVVPLRKGRKGKSKVTVRKETPPANIEVHIGRQLKAIYDDVLNQPIPDRFLDLLSKLEEKTSGNPSRSGDEGGEK